MWGPFKYWKLWIQRSHAHKASYVLKFSCDRDCQQNLFFFLSTYLDYMCQPPMHLCVTMSLSSIERNVKGRDMYHFKTWPIKTSHTDFLCPFLFHHLDTDDNTDLGNHMLKMVKFQEWRNLGPRIDNIFRTLHE